MARRRNAVPVSRLEEGGCRVDIYPPKDGMWALEIYQVDVQNVGVAAPDLKTAEQTARRALAAYAARRRQVNRPGGA